MSGRSDPARLPVWAGVLLKEERKTVLNDENVRYVDTVASQPRVDAAWTQVGHLTFLRNDNVWIKGLIDDKFLMRTLEMVVDNVWTL